MLSLKFDAVTGEMRRVSTQATQTYYVLLNEYINIHMNKLMR